jgi:hypothetical protein
MIATRLAFACALAVVVGATTAATPLAATAPSAAPSAAPAAPPSLLEPDPLGFDLDTGVGLVAALRDLPDRLAEGVPVMAARGRALGPGGSALIASLFFAIAATVVGQRRLARRAETATSTYSGELGASARAPGSRPRSRCSPIPRRRSSSGSATTPSAA